MCMQSEGNWSTSGAMYISFVFRYPNRIRIQRREWLSSFVATLKTAFRSIYGYSYSISKGYCNSIAFFTCALITISLNSNMAGRCNRAQAHAQNITGMSMAHTHTHTLKFIHRQKLNDKTDTTTHSYNWTIDWNHCVVASPLWLDYTSHYLYLSIYTKIVVYRCYVHACISIVYATDT